MLYCFVLSFVFAEDPMFVELVALESRFYVFDRKERKHVVNVFSNEVKINLN